jgi:hypothetical protein
LHTSLTQNRPASKIIEQGPIRNVEDLVKLHIIDWRRLNGSYQHEYEAMKVAESWLAGRASYTIIDHDLNLAPERDDWPEWEHVGNHTGIARLFWNDFHYRLKGSLNLVDEPDFYGSMQFKDSSNDFWGDIGQVSAQCFLLVMRQMKAHDLWISLLDEKRQVIIEPNYNLQFLYMHQLIPNKEALEREERETAMCFCKRHVQISMKDLVQLPLF